MKLFKPFRKSSILNPKKGPSDVGKWWGGLKSSERHAIIAMVLIAVGGYAAYSAEAAAATGVGSGTGMMASYGGAEGAAAYGATTGAGYGAGAGIGSGTGMMASYGNATAGAGLMDTGIFGSTAAASSMGAASSPYAASSAGGTGAQGAGNATTLQSTQPAANTGTNSLLSSSPGPATATTPAVTTPTATTSQYEPIAKAMFQGQVLQGISGGLQAQSAEDANRSQMRFQAGENEKNRTFNAEQQNQAIAARKTTWTPTERTVTPTQGLMTRRSEQPAQTYNSTGQTDQTPQSEQRYSLAELQQMQSLFSRKSFLE